MATSSTVVNGEQLLAVLEDLDEVDSSIDIPVENGDELSLANGKVKIIASDIVPEGTWLLTTEMEEAFKAAKPETPEGQEKVKFIPLVKGFMFQAATPMIGNEPFYLEVHLIGEGQYAVSGNKNGVLSRTDIKALRKGLKGIMSLEKEQFDIKSGTDQDYEYYDGQDDPGYEDEF